MALPVLDGNQTATTLSSVVTGGEHIVAHSVVSLGANAIANITSAVSGSVVSISNFPATQPISGSVSISGTPSVTFGQAVVSASNIGNLNDSVGTDSGTPTSTKFIKIGGHQDGQNQVEHIVHVSAGGAMKVDASDSSVTFGLASVTFSAVTISNFPSTQTVAGTVTVGGFSSVSVGSGAILAAGLRGGTITPIPIDSGSGRVAGSAVVQYNVGGPTPYQDVTSSFPLPVQVVSQGSVTIGSLPSISGTVTVNVATRSWHNFYGITTESTQFIAVGGYDTPNGQIAPIPLTDGASGVFVAQDASVSPVWNVGGTVTANNQHLSSNSDGGGFPVVRAGIYAYDYNSDIQVGISVLDPESGSPALNIGGTVTIGSLPAISGTVTVGGVPNGSLTTRFGTPTTANTAFATSAVTNASRKYLLIQNVTTGSNVITVGIGFTPTTTQGIQLTAGAGITFESSYIPTGAVRILSSVTASNFTILEA